MNNTSKFIIYTLYAIVCFIFPVISMKLTNGFSSEVKFFFGIMIMLIMIIGNAIFFYWLQRYNFLKRHKTNANILLSLMPTFDFMAFCQSIKLEIVAIMVGTLIFAYGFSKSDFMIMVIGLGFWYYPYDRITDKASSLFYERVNIVIKQMRL